MFPFLLIPITYVHNSELHTIHIHTTQSRNTDHTYVRRQSYK